MKVVEKNYGALLHLLLMAVRNLSVWVGILIVSSIWMKEWVVYLLDLMTSLL